ncbi:hypothetical protein KIPB_001494, partial [Kipferlia bialata]|eukprot:g1494.t1
MAKGVRGRGSVRRRPRRDGEGEMGEVVDISDDEGIEILEVLMGKSTPQKKGKRVTRVSRGVVSPSPSASASVSTPMSRPKRQRRMASGAMERAPPMTQ